MLHLLGVAFPLILLTCFLPSLWLTSLLILLSHAIIDFGKSSVAKCLHLSTMWTFLADQMLHLVIIVLLTGSIFCPYLTVNAVTAQVLNLILFLVLITKPTNVVFKIFFQKYQREGIK